MVFIGYLIAMFPRTSYLRLFAPGFCLIFILSLLPLSAAEKTFRAGAAKIDITPELGVSLNGGMQDRKASLIHDPLHSRAIVLDDGETKLAIVVNDSCMIPRELFDTSKAIAEKATGIPADNMMTSATHTHTAPTVANVFQSSSNPGYREELIIKIAEAIIQANANLEPAKIGWGTGSESGQVFNRRWYMNPEVELKNPFGAKDLAKMNPPAGSKDLIKPAGPIDPTISVLSLVSADGRPIGLLANYSLHYVGGAGGGHVSADYFGVFAKRFSEMIGASTEGDKAFVAMMSNGTSGDINNINFTRKQVRKPAYEQMQLVGDLTAAEAYKVWRQIQYHDWVPLGSKVKPLILSVRKPDADDIAFADQILARHAEKKIPRLATREEIYAGETKSIAQFPPYVDIKLQAFRIGDVGIAAIPCETFVEIGLELRLNSPFQTTWTHSLANGYNGYLPTQKHHELGGYETWRAKSSYLGTNSAHQVVSTLDDLFQQMAK